MVFQGWLSVPGLVSLPVKLTNLLGAGAVTTEELLGVDPPDGAPVMAPNDPTPIRLPAGLLKLRLHADKIVHADKMNARVVFNGDDEKTNPNMKRNPAPIGLSLTKYM